MRWYRNKQTETNKMRKELYELLIGRLQGVRSGAIKHIDLWNHNVEFIEQEDQWERPAVFVEFHPIQWRRVKTGSDIVYTSHARVSLHVVTDWHGSSSAVSSFRSESLSYFDLLDDIHSALRGMNGLHFNSFDLVESQTSHNHEELLESIETYQCVVSKSLR